MDKAGKDKAEKITEEFLMTVGSEAELSIIEGILRAENILYIVRHREAGGAVAVYTGFSVFGADVFVSSEDIERAKAAVFDNTGLEE